MESESVPEGRGGLQSLLNIIHLSPTHPCQQSPSMKNYKYMQIESMQVYLKRKDTTLLKIMVIWELMGSAKYGLLMSKKSWLL